MHRFSLIKHYLYPETVNNKLYSFPLSCETYQVAVLLQRSSLLFERKLLHTTRFELAGVICTRKIALKRVVEVYVHIIYT